jgi:3-isopropylmalate dehydratase small subunit
VREHALLVEEVRAAGSCEATVDLRTREIELASGRRMEFDVDARRRAQLLTGEDEIASTLRKQPKIDAFRDAHARRSVGLYLHDARRRE